MTDIMDKWAAVLNAADDWPKEWCSANRTAQLAMSGVHADAVGILVRLLRSDTPLDPALRRVLAAAIEGTRPPGTLNFKPCGVPTHGEYSPMARDRFRRDVEIGEFIANELANGSKQGAAEQKAADEFGQGLDLVHKIAGGYRKMMKWAAEVETRRGEPFTADQRRSFCLNTYLGAVGPLTK